MSDTNFILVTSDGTRITVSSTYESEGSRHRRVANAILAAASQTLYGPDAMATAYLKSIMTSYVGSVFTITYGNAKAPMADHRAMTFNMLDWQMDFPNADNPYLAEWSQDIPSFVNAYANN